MKFFSVQSDVTGSISGNYIYCHIMCCGVFSVMALLTDEKKNEKGNNEITTSTPQTVRYTCLTYLY